MNLQTIFDAQALFQRHINAHPEDMVDPEQKIQYIKDMVLAAEDELHEVLGEIGWKPWATSRHIHVDAVKSELVDTFQFFMNLCLAVGMTADELGFLHTEKLKKNYARANAQYDGISTKCPYCKRAYDDDAVSCEPSVEGTSLAYCVKKNNDTGDGFINLKQDDRCPRCHRAYGAQFVNCFPTIEEDSDGKGRQGYCAQTQQELE